MAGFTSEFDSNSIAGEEMQRHLSHYFFSLTNILVDLDDASKKPKVAATELPPRELSSYDRSIWNVPAVRVLFFCFWLSANSLSSPVNGLSDGRRPKANVGVHSS